MNQASLIDVLLFSLIGGALSLVGGVALLFGNATYLQKFTKLAIPFAAGSLLGAVFLDLLKEGLEHSTPSTVLIATLGGILAFFTLERITQWFHHHHEEDDHTHESVSLFVLANTLHNALDGIAIGSAFMVSIPAGIITTVAVAAHEIPHELGDIGVLVARGMSKTKVLVVNICGSLSSVILAVLTFKIGGVSHLPVGALLGISAGFLIYVASSDLIPTIHRKQIRRGWVDVDLLVLFFGVGVVAVAIELAHKFIR
jgi:zinc and cadmium transporter